MSKTELNSTVVENSALELNTAYVDSRIVGKIDNLVKRHETARNIARYYLRGNSGSYVSVRRLIGERLKELNSTEHNILHGMKFDRAYAVQVTYSFVDPITGKNRENTDTVARVGIIGKRKYLLNSSGSVAMQTRTRQNEEDLLRAINTIAKAKKLAESKGVVNENEFFLALPVSNELSQDYITMDNDGFDI